MYSHPKTGRKKGGIKVHTVIHANEGIPFDLQFTSAATNDSFMLIPSKFSEKVIVTMDRAYINYEKFEELTEHGVIHVTKMKKNLNHELLFDFMEMAPEGKMEYREQIVVFRKGRNKAYSKNRNLCVYKKRQTAQIDIAAYQ